MWAANGKESDLTLLVEYLFNIMNLGMLAHKPTLKNQGSYKDEKYYQVTSIEK